MKYKLGVYGDSIALGYGNNNQSWFDDLSSGIRALKTAQNGMKTGDVAQKASRDTNTYQTLIVAVGINDLLQEEGVTEILPIMRRYAELLELVCPKAERVIIQAVLPVRENLFPDQEWLEEPRWAFNQNIEKFNQGVKDLGRKRQMLYLDAYAKFKKLPLEDFYLDAVHLNTAGHQQLCQIYQKLFA